MLSEYDSNPVWGSGKRRRRISGASCESRSKDRRTSVEAASNLKSGTATQKQVSSGFPPTGLLMPLLFWDIGRCRLVICLLGPLDP